MKSPIETLLARSLNLREKATPRPWSTVSDLPNYAVVNMEKTEGGQWIKRIVVASENHCHRWHGDTFGCNQHDGEFISHECTYSETKDAIIAELVAALEEFRLGHEHAPDLTHTRAMGDSYGWCDYCSAKVSWGPGIAELALEKVNALAAKAMENQ